MMLLAPLNALGRLVLAVALLLSTTPHSHSAKSGDHAASIEVISASIHSHDEVADIGHAHDAGVGEQHDSGHGHGQKVGDHVHDKPCQVSIAATPRSPMPKCWDAPVRQRAWKARSSRLDRPPRRESL